MSKNLLTNIVSSNKELVLNRTVNIPKTLQIDYDNKFVIPFPIKNDTKVRYETMKTDDCAKHYLDLGYSQITIMNFASRHHHGGGYTNGAKAQEEDLCRVAPGLYPSLTKIKYPYPPDSVLITPEVLVMRENSRYQILPEKKQFYVNIVSAAAQSLRHEKFDEERVIRTLKNLFCSVHRVLPNTEVLILGAWGCGAYGNDPYIIATIMNNVTKMYGGYFKCVVYSVPEGINSKEFREIIETTKD